MAGVESDFAHKQTAFFQRNHYFARAHGAILIKSLQNLPCVTYYMTLLAEVPFEIVLSNSRRIYFIHHLIIWRKISWHVCCYSQWISFQHIVWYAVSSICASITQLTNLLFMLMWFRAWTNHIIWKSTKYDKTTEKAFQTTSDNNGNDNTQAVYLMMLRAKNICT